VLGGKEFGKRGNIIRPLAQRRYFEFKSLETKIKILPKLSGRNQRLQRTV
jgi:hypothetical protein